MNKIFTLVALLVATLTFAQSSETILTGGGVMDVYYDFETGNKTSVDRNTWDIGLTTNRMWSSIIINENGGAELFLYSADTSDWSTVDTTGLTWENIYNSEESWANGAFSNLGTNHPDYGWGVYQANHDIVAKRIFIIKNTLGEYWKIMMPAMKATGEFTVRAAKIGDATESTYTFNKNNASAKNFHLITVRDNIEEVATNPAKADWDIQLTKYITFVQQGPTGKFQPVSGVKINAGCEVAQRDGISVDSDDTSSLAWNTNITEIGWDWKTFEFATSSYSMAPDRAYFVRTVSGAVWKIWFTNYTVGTAEYSFNTKLIGSSASAASVANLNTSIYPNPTNGVLNIANRENETLNITLTNVQGMLVYTGSVLAFSKATLSTSEYAKGIYFLQMSSPTIRNTQRVIFE